MKRTLNALFPILAIALFFVFISDSAAYLAVFLDGITIWAYNVLPAIFPFAVLFALATKPLMRCKTSLSAKLFNCDCDTAFLCSLVCGYPIGSKLISECKADEDAIARASSFCSSPAPIFLIATVGKLLASVKATLILLISNLLAVFLNGFTHKNKTRTKLSIEQNNSTFGDIVTSSVLASLTVGGLIALFYMLSAMLKSFLPNGLSNSAYMGFAFGLLEMTGGIIQVCQTADIKTATVLCCALTSFGGMCVILQSYAFLSTKKMKMRNLFLQKITQCCYCTLCGFILSLLFL